MSDDKETKDSKNNDSKSPVNEELIGNLLSVNQWLRIVLMILFIFLGWAVRFLQYILVIVQTIIALFTGSENTRLARAGEIAALYQAQIWLFVSYASNHKPFPFSDLPEDASSLDLSSGISSGKTYDAEPAAEDDKSDDAGFDQADEPEPEPEIVQVVDDFEDQDDDEDDVFADMSFSSAGKDFVDPEDDEDDENENEKKDS